MNMRQDKGKSEAVVTTWWQILQNKWHIMTNARCVMESDWKSNIMLDIEHSHILAANSSVCMCV